MRDNHDDQPEMLAFEVRFARIVTELLKRSNDDIFGSKRRAACLLAERPHGDMPAPEVNILEVTDGHPLYGAFSDWSQCLHVDLPNYLLRIKGSKPTDLKDIRDQKAIEERTAAIFRVAENFNSRVDLLKGVNLAVSPGLAALESMRNRVIPSAAPSSPGSIPDSTWSMWEQAIGAAQLRRVARLRLQIWLRRKQGEKVASVQHDYPMRNIPRDVRDAIKRDLPGLRRAFPNLPDLGGDKP